MTEREQRTFEIPKREKLGVALGVILLSAILGICAVISFLVYAIMQLLP